MICSVDVEDTVREIRYGSGTLLVHMGLLSISSGLGDVDCNAIHLDARKGHPPSGWHHPESERCRYPLGMRASRLRCVTTSELVGQMLDLVSCLQIQRSIVGLVYGNLRNSHAWYCDSMGRNVLL